MSLKLFAPMGVEFGGHEEQPDDRDEDQIIHGGTMLPVRWGG